MKRKKVALYDPYLDVYGGGEKHILSILQVLADEGYEVSIFWDTDVSTPLKNKLNISFQQPISYLPNIFKTKGNVFQKLKILKQFDMFFYVPDGGYFFSAADKNFVFAMYPDKNIYPTTLFNKLKTYNFKFIANSKYTQSWLVRWGIHAKVLYPFLEGEFVNFDFTRQVKQKYILTVGRFYRHLHAKRQDQAIKIFQSLQKEIPQLNDFTFILAGGLKEEDRPYFEELQNMIGYDSSIVLKPNIPFAELFDLYKQSLFYWHFAGYGVEEQKHPEAVEHLGITPLEAMACGCVVFCFNAGGPKEIIH
ncbi:glycosyltransferase family 4 protein, partial [Candidatus Roizmanbacteria bacterium]|nr:glycosyltransferase family 4 protein [Candidatus Roizmanbacteria bacterium]